MIIVNITETIHEGPGDLSEGVKAQQANVRRTLNEDVSRWIKRVTRSVASFWRTQSRPVNTRDRVIDATQL